MPKPDELTQARIVRMILSKDTEQALHALSKFCRIKPPEIVIGTLKGKRKTVYAVYVPKERRMYARDSDIFYNPFVVLRRSSRNMRTAL